MLGRAAAVIIAAIAAALVFAAPSDATLLTGANHWAHTSLPARVGILVNPAALAQDVADGADAWTSSTLAYGVVGSTSGSDCDQSTNGRRGYVVVCVSVTAPAGGGTWTYIHSECWYQPSPCDSTHIAGAVMYSSSLSPGTYVFCHELGHAIGQAHSGSGCMTAGASGQCPSATDLAEEEQNYNHIDDHDSAAAFGSFTVIGNANCGGTPSPTPTPAPTSTPPPTPIPVPTTTPIPNVCAHNPSNWKCPGALR